MNSITLKNLWSRRKRNAWIFIELIVFTFVTWVVIEPVIKDVYRRLLPRGYEPDRIVVVDLSFTNMAHRNLAEYYMDRLRNIEGVETVCAMPHNRYSSKSAIGVLGYGSDGRVNGDSAIYHIVWGRFDYDFFDAHGIRNVRGNKVGRVDTDKVVVTRGFAEQYLGGVDVVGKEVRLNSYGFSHNLDVSAFDKVLTDEYTRKYIIADVVENIRFCAGATPENASPKSIFLHSDNEYEVYGRFALRMKDGVDPQRFISEKKKDIERMMMADGDDNTMVDNVVLAEDLNAQAENDAHLIQPIRTRKILVAFFLINLVLGIIGAFWLNAKKRSEETGIQRAFGATRARVVWSYIKEGWVMVTAAFVIAACLFFNYTLNNEIDYSYIDKDCLTVVDTFWSNFAIDAVIVYMIMMAVVAVGIAIPTVRMSKSKPVDLLN